jgi:iron(III) transport system ATP-binding protein
VSHIVIDSVYKKFDDFIAVNNANMEIREGEFFTLLGPSGCGKTTLLRTLAGFYRQEEGHIYFGDKLIDDVPAYKRNIGMVFQNYAIFPHMTVFENVAYGLKARKVKKQELETRVMQALEMVELAHLRDSQPSNLSGGQQQRVALARAVVIHPGLLLMDEPLSNLDAKLRVKMRYDIKEMQNRLNITTIYVTHDQEEALAVSDRIAIMYNGKVQQIGKPYEIYLSPQNQFVANFIGTSNFIAGTCQAYDSVTGKARIQVEGVRLEMPLTKVYQGDIVYSVRPEQLKIVDSAAEEAHLNGKITDATFLGETVEYKVQLENEQVIQVHEQAVSYDQLRKAGDRVRINLNPEAAVLFSQNGEEALNLYAASQNRDADQAKQA